MAPPRADPRLRRGRPGPRASGGAACPLRRAGGKGGDTPSCHRQCPRLSRRARARRGGNERAGGRSCQVAAAQHPARPPVRTRGRGSRGGPGPAPPSCPPCASPSPAGSPCSSHPPTGSACLCAMAPAPSCPVAQVRCLLPTPALGGRAWGQVMIQVMYTTPLVAQTVKHLVAMREIWVRSLGRKDPLEEEKATHSSVLAWRIPWTEEPGGPQSMGSPGVRQD